MNGAVVVDQLGISRFDDIPVKTLKRELNNIIKKNLFQVKNQKFHNAGS